MVSNVRISWSAIALQAVAAGLVGAVTLEWYVWFTTLRPVHGSVAILFSQIEHQALGKTTFGNDAAVGAIIHLLVSVVWAGAYAYVAMGRPIVNVRWPISGLVYGIIVYGIMQLILLAANAFIFPSTPAVVYNALFAHAVFFGIPVAAVVAAMQKARTRA
jgi:hypothetical protein